MTQASDRRKRAGLLPQGNENLLDVEFLAETRRYGNPSPSTKLGLQRNPNAATVVDMGIVPLKTTRGFPTRGVAGISDEGDTVREVVSNFNYKSPKEYYDKMKKKGVIREGLSYEDWISKTRPLEDEENFVAGIAHAIRPLRPTMWSHEFAHLGQFDTPQSGSGKEARQRMRDIMYPSLRHPEEIEDDILFLEKLGYKIGDDNWIKLHNQTLLEDQYATKVLENDWKKSGKKGELPDTGKPNLQIFQDWLAGGRTKGGYKSVVKKRRNSIMNLKN